MVKARPKSTGESTGWVGCGMTVGGALTLTVVSALLLPKALVAVNRKP